MVRDATAAVQQRFADAQIRDGWLRAEQPEGAPGCIKFEVVEPLAEFSRMVEENTSRLDCEGSPMVKSPACYTFHR